MPSVSVVIPVRDGARYLAEVLAALARQSMPHDVLVIDSGSRDGSPQIARAAGATVLEIDPADFGHGRTRNLGVQRTSGEIVCFLTQDATPLDGWLEAMLEAFALDDRIGAVFGPHLPRPDSSPMIARELTDFFEAFAPTGAPAIQRPGDETYLSNSNAAYRRACVGRIGFRDVPYAEDQAFGIDMFAAGWLKVYQPRAAVLHAHDYGALDFMRRYFDEFRALAQTTGWVQPFSPRATAGAVRRLVAADRRWMRERRWPARKRAAWTARAVVHHLGRQVFAALGAHADSLPPRLRRQLSLEGRAAHKRLDTRR